MDQKAKNNFKDIINEYHKFRSEKTIISTPCGLCFDLSMNNDASLKMINYCAIKNVQRK